MRKAVMYSLEYFPEVREDLSMLSQEILEEIFEYFEKYRVDPYRYSQKLYNQGKLNLEGYRKTYVANATYRIVIKIEDDVAKVVEVIVVGKREEKEVYQTASKRTSI